MENKQLNVWQAACIITGYSVGGGIMAVAPGKTSIAVYDPKQI